MDLKQLRSLVTVAETGNVTKAADLLHVVQPAISRQLRLLEEDLGVPLFDRGRHGMALTEAGITMVEYAKRILNEVDRARAEMKPAQGSVGGIVTIGLLPSVADLLSGPILSAMQNKYPGIRVRITVGYSGHLPKWLEAGEVDFALLYDLKPNPLLNVTPILEESLWVVGSPAHKLRQNKPVPLSWLIKQEVVLPSPHHGLRLLVDQASNLMKYELNVSAETNALSVQKSMVLSGHSVTVLPAVAVVDDIKRGLLTAAPIKEPAIQRKIILALPANRQTTAPVQCTIPLLIQCMKDAVKKGSWPSAKWLYE
jgi:LysR family transcriptional regulator, nitrogen assimilation regulatory protein